MKTRFKLLFAALGTISFFPSAMAATWTGASSGSWATSGNWTGTAPDNITPQSIVFDATSTANLTQTLNASYTVTGITVGSPTGAVTVNNGTGTNALTIGASGIDLSAATQNLTVSGSNVTIGAEQNWNVQTGRTLNVGSSGGTITLSNKLTKTGTGTFTLGGAGATTLTGAGVLEINGGTFTNNMQAGSGSTGRSGATTLTSGTLTISTSISMFGTGALNLNGGAIGSGTTTGRNISNSVNIGGSVRFGGSGLSSGTMTFSGPIDFGGAARSLDSSITGGQGTIFSGKVSNGGLTLNGASAGILTLSNDTNDFTGATTITSGYLAISNSALATSASVSMAASTRLFIGVNGTTKINNLSGTSTSAIRSDFTITGTTGSRALEITQTSDGTFAGTFTEGGSRPISLTKKGSATLTLSNTAAFTGGTTIHEGTLQVSDGGTLGTGPVTNNSSLMFSCGVSASLVSVNAISGNGSISKIGEGSLAFTGTSSTFTGNIDLNGGLLRMGPHLGSGILTVKSGTFISCGLPATNAISQAGSMVLEGDTESDFRLGAINDSINLSGTLTAPVTGIHTINIFGTPTSGGSHKLIDYAGAALSGTDFARFTLGSLPSGTATFQLVNNTDDSSIDLLVTLENQVWKGSTDGNWDLTTTNWALASTPGTPAVFSVDNPALFDDSAALFNVIVDAAGVSPLAVSFNNTANAYTFTGGAIGGAGSLTKAGSNSVTLSQSNSYNGGTTINGGKLQIGSGGGTGDIGGGAVAVASGATLEFNRANAVPGTPDLDYKTNAKLRNVSGGGDIVLTGGAMLFNYPGSGTGFAEANSWAGFSGNLTVKGGSEFQTLRNGSSAMGTGNVTLGDGVTSGALSQIEGTWTWTNNIVLVGSANAIRNRSNSNFARALKLQGVISGSGGLSFEDPSGSMTDVNRGFILTNTNTLNGTLTIAAATPVRVGGVPGNVDASTPGLLADNSGTLGAATVINHGTLTFSRKDSHTVSNPISGTGSLRFGIPAAAALGDTTTQVLTYTGAAIHTGATTVNNGTLIIGTGALMGGSSFTVAPTAILGGTGTVTAPVTASGTIAPGTGGVGDLTIGDTILSGTYACDVSGVDSDKLIFGTLNITGATLTLSGAPSAPSYLIATYTGTLAGTFMFTPPSGYDLDYTTPGEIKLVSTGGYDSWKATFGAGFNATNNGFAQDPDNDGIPNLLEYVLNGNPLTSSQGNLPTLDASGASFVFAFTRRLDSGSDTTQVFQYGSDLSGWTDVNITGTPGSEVTIGASTGIAPNEVQLITVSVPKSGTKMFGRIKASKQRVLVQ